ncbi:MAG: hypothetical protein M1817_003535 [Caeruleum heppii]|nr:MAG: hypothetical protein M1817_003535 [Caeruleum heppii]
MSGPPPGYNQGYPAGGPPPQEGAYYPPPPEKSNQQPQHGSSAQYYPPPPPQATPPGNNYPPPPQPPQQSQPQQSPSPSNPRASYQAQPSSHSQSYSHPPPSGGNVGAHPGTAGFGQPQQPMTPLNANVPSQMPGGAPAAGHFMGASSTQDDVGTFNGGSYRISHRDSNSILTLQLAMGCPLIAKPGAMISMSPTVTLKGAVKFTLKKLLAGGDIGTSTYTGPGELLLAPTTLGDITNIRLGGNEQWSVGKDAFLAATQGVVKEYKSQGFGKAMFSGEGMYVYRISGQGILWITSFGAIIRKDLQPEEKYIVDNGHLVAWNSKYVLERVASGGIISGMSSGEGLVCKFTGPGTVFIQTRNPQAFGAYINAQTSGQA